MPTTAERLDFIEQCQTFQPPQDLKALKQITINTTRVSRFFSQAFSLIPSSGICNLESEIRNPESGIYPDTS